MTSPSHANAAVGDMKKPTLLLMKISPVFAARAHVTGMAAMMANTQLRTPISTPSNTMWRGVVPGGGPVGLRVSRSRGRPRTFRGGSGHARELPTELSRDAAKV